MSDRIRRAPASTPQKSKPPSISPQQKLSKTRSNTPIPAKPRSTSPKKNGHLILTVSDDGDGFDPNIVTTGAGTTNPTERITTIGGRLNIDSQPGEGTTITATIPLPKEH